MLKLYQPGDFVYVKAWNFKSLKEKMERTSPSPPGNQRWTQGIEHRVHHAQVQPETTDEIQQKEDWHGGEVFFSFTSCEEFVFLCFCLET